MIDRMCHIEAFLAVARLTSFTRASAELHVSQPALTVQIKQLEDSLGVKLFDRNNRHVALTAAGRDVLAPLERVLIEAEQVMNRTQNLANLRRGLVKVAAEPVFGAWLLPVALGEFANRYPDVEWRASDVMGEKVIELVKAGDVDFGIGSYIRGGEDVSLPQLLADRQIEVQPLFSDRVCAVMHRDHRLAAQRAVTVRDLGKCRIIRVDHPFRGHLEYMLYRAGFSLASNCTTNFVTTAIGMARANLGIALLPASVIRRRSNLRCIAFQPAWTCEVGIITKAGHLLSHPAEKLFEILQRLGRRVTRRQPQLEGNLERNPQ